MVRSKNVFFHSSAVYKSHSSLNGDRDFDVQLLSAFSFVIVFANVSHNPSNMHHVLSIVAALLVILPCGFNSEQRNGRRWDSLY